MIKLSVHHLSHIFYVSMWSFLSLVCLVSVSAVIDASSAQTMIKSYIYQATTSSNGAQVKTCTNEPPTRAIQLPQGSKVSRCSGECLNSPDCLVYQMKTDLARCELFNYIPKNVSVIAECAAFSSRDLCATNTTYPYVIDSQNCSFPFTYKGELFVSCTTKLTAATNICSPSACLMTNRNMARCYQPADFVAESYVINVTTPGQRNVTTASIFDWIVIMTRNNKQGNWGRPWTSYRDGFTLSETDFWLGLRRMYLLTSFASYRLRIEVYIPKTGSNWRSVEYSTFSISSGSTGYAATFAGFTGDSADCLATGSQFNLNGMKFSTYDVDNDFASGSCSISYGYGGWWFNNCARACLTCGGVYTDWCSSDAVIEQSRMMIKLN